MRRRRFLPLLIAPGLGSGCRASDALHSSMGPPLNTLRILCLHGYHGSADILRRQMAALVDGLDDVAQFVCVDAPSLAAGDFGWWHAKAAPDSPDHDDAGVDARSRHYQGWQRTRDGIVSLFAQHGPFDGVFGFSQGAALTGLLVGLRAPDGHASAARPLVFDFAAMVGGFPAADPALATLYDETTSYGLPSVHIIGRADSIVPAGVSRALASRFANPLVLEHAGGHVIASTPEIRARFRAFLEAMLELRDKRAPQTAAPAPPPRPLPATLELPLWPGRAHPSMRLHFPPNAGTDKARPAMLVFAGGAYASCNGSGHDSAEWLSRQGMVGISVEYTTRSTGGAYPANFSDAARAVRLVRSRAAEWGIAAGRIGVMGFSAGGHLASLLSSRPDLQRQADDDVADRFSARPDLVVLAYPVISFVDGYVPGALGGTVENFFGARAVGEDRRREVSSELHVDPSHPPVFIWTTRSDGLVPYRHSELFVDACKRQHVPVTYTLYPSGSHGLGLASGVAGDVGRWTSALLRWITERWGPLEAQT